MRILKIDELIEVCKTLSSEKTKIREEVEEMLVQVLLVSMCAEFEGIPKGLVIERCSAVNDPMVFKYATSFSDNAFSSPSKKNISDAIKIKRFGGASSGEFERLKMSDGEAWIAYGDIVANRNNAAHGRPVQATIDEVEKFYKNAHVVLDWFKKALWTGEVEGSVSE